MCVDIPPSDSFVTAAIKLSTDEWQVDTKITFPAGLTTWRVMLPVLQAFTDRVVGAAIQQTHEEGKEISCKKGCGACCRQLVPISEVEARRLRDLVNDLPEPRQAEIMLRFGQARQRLEDAGVLDSLIHPERVTEWRPLGLRYFGLGIPCPFLEEESCSIHPDRPLACREYLVTTPAENCTRPTAETVHCVHMPLKASDAFFRCSEAPAVTDSVRWVPLILALD